jgi:hypothetical protein
MHPGGLAGPPAIIRVRRLEVLMLVTMLSFVFGGARLGRIHLLGTTRRQRGDTFSGSNDGDRCGVRLAVALRRVSEDRPLSRHSGYDGGDLVGLADQPGLQLGFEHQRGRGVVAGPCLVVKTLRRADRVR